MTNITRDFFIYLSQNKLLNTAAKKWGLQLGATKVVAGTNVASVTNSIKKLNAQGISCTVDHLGEFVYEKQEAIEAKQHCIAMLQAIAKEKLDCHISIKLTQVGLDIDEAFCFENMEAILRVAQRHDIFINIDMEDYAHYEQTLDMLKRLSKKFDHVGTVVQAYLYRSEQDLTSLENCRLRLVKGAYKEDPAVAYQSRKEIDENFLELIKTRLLTSQFTSIATHDHHIIQKVKAFADAHHISRDKFEFQMLYGFRTELQEQLVQEGYHFCTYVPFGKDWYGYFMRRLAERPQNLNFIVKDLLFKPDGKVKKTPMIVATATISLILYKFVKKKK